MERELFTSREVPSGYVDFRRTSTRKVIALLLTGPNGVGKGSITSELLKDPALSLTRAVRYASRPKGESEEHGREYYFTSHEEFTKMVHRGEIIEQSSHGMGYYGTGRDVLYELENGQNNLLFDVEAHATFVLRNIFQRIGVPYTDVLLSPVPTEQLHDLDLVIQTLRRRITSRQRGESESEILRRLYYAKETYNRANEFTHIIANNDGALPQAVAQIRRLLTTQ